MHLRAAAASRGSYRLRCWVRAPRIPGGMIGAQTKAAPLLPEVLLSDGMSEDWHGGSGRRFGMG
jgi:hypothetical protein